MIDNIYRNDVACLHNKPVTKEDKLLKQRNKPYTKYGVVSKQEARYMEDTPTNRERLALSVQREVQFAAFKYKAFERYSETALTDDDFTQAANLGVCVAIDKWLTTEPLRRGFSEKTIGEPASVLEKIIEDGKDWSFYSFTKMYIKKYIFDMLYNVSSHVRVPTYSSEKVGLLSFKSGDKLMTYSDDFDRETNSYTTTKFDVYAMRDFERSVPDSPFIDYNENVGRSLDDEVIIETILEGARREGLVLLLANYGLGVEKALTCRELGVIKRCSHVIVHRKITMVRNRIIENIENNGIDYYDFGSLVDVIYHTQRNKAWWYKFCIKKLYRKFVQS